MAQISAMAEKVTASGQSPRNRQHSKVSNSVLALKLVTQAHNRSKIVSSSLDKEYAGITGVPSFTKAAALLAYGPNSKPIQEDRVAIIQSISGTGALRIGGAFLERFYPGAKTIYIPTRRRLRLGVEVKQYKYYNTDTIGLDFDGMIADLVKPEGDYVPWDC
ncbi:hypothetical protein AYL99_11869 [Fonsecaea erecta]|uniref:Aminotransferase class I/classII large domain-containing protein n=1 Tax=Fonsecaea erecta TaxID=1367422 RepID=A0A178Z2G0_9EURO|nr:hypothetical protein AYL99_11869 [Fonsecaea erecta]OAP53989.1 hypothetical protein AYL99_11869 [Fonsecaea erecta]